MDAAAIHKKLAERFPGSVGQVVEGSVEKSIEIDVEKIERVAELLKSDPALRFDCLSNLSGTDYPDKGTIQVIYNLFSYQHRHELTLKVNADRGNPVVPTLERVWPAAQWLEREAYDLLGVIFTGHSDLRRILLPDDWVGFPLRKDYVEAPEYHGISTVRESMLDLPGRS